MLFFQGKRNGLKQILRPSDFEKLGVRAEYEGADAVFISRNGRPLGQIKRTVGKFVWYAAETGEPRFSAFDCQKILSAVARNG